MKKKKKRASGTTHTPNGNNGGRRVSYQDTLGRGKQNTSLPIRFLRGGRGPLAKGNIRGTDGPVPAGAKRLDLVLSP